VPLVIDHLISGGLITNYYCSSTCRHCLYRCSPRWPREFISRQDALTTFTRIKGFGCNGVHIGGGEPLLNPEGVLSVLDAATEAGVTITYLETNSSWYKDRDSARVLLEKLAAHGLETLLISISPFHNEYIPLYKIKGVIKACHEAELALFPWIADFYLDLEHFDEKSTHNLEEYAQHFGEDYIENLPHRYGIIPGGRALETFRPYVKEQTIEELVKEKRNGCRELAETSHFHIDLYGNYVPGMCAGLSVGKEDLGAPLDPDSYPIITRLFEGGIGALLSWAAECHGFRPSRDTYATECQLCYEIRHYLTIDRAIASRELQPTCHYRCGD